MLGYFGRVADRTELDMLSFVWIVRMINSVMKTQILEYNVVKNNIIIIYNWNEEIFSEILFGKNLQKSLVAV